MSDGIKRAHEDAADFSDLCEKYGIRDLKMYSEKHGMIKAIDREAEAKKRDVHLSAAARIELVLKGKIKPKKRPLSKSTHYMEFG